MEVYKHKSPIVLSYTQLGNKKYIEVFFGTDEKLRFLLSREPEILFLTGKPSFRQKVLCSVIFMTDILRTHTLITAGFM